MKIGCLNLLIALRPFGTQSVTWIRCGELTIEISSMNPGTRTAKITIGFARLKFSLIIRQLLRALGKNPGSASALYGLNPGFLLVDVSARKEQEPGFR